MKRYVNGWFSMGWGYVIARDLTSYQFLLQVARIKHPY
jgi:hypothetical protein